LFLADFAGCIEDIIWINQISVQMSTYMVDGQNVRFDGCPDFVVGAQSCVDTSPRIVYSGRDTTAYDTGLASFTGILTIQSSVCFFAVLCGLHSMTKRLLVLAAQVFIITIWKVLERRLVLLSDPGWPARLRL
jgi:hypothetical protein